MAETHCSLCLLKQELRFLLENETVFKRIPKLNIDMFIKYFFPEKGRNSLA